MADARIGVVADAVPAGLTEDQKRAFRYATQAGGKLRTITGVPGAGKTRLINAAADAYRAEGYTVRAASVANSAVEVLRTDTDVPARSVASELWQWSQDRERRGPRDVLIIDEASTLGTAWARDLLAEARTRGGVDRDGIECGIETLTNAELHLVDRHVKQRSLVVGMTRHTHRYGMHYSAEAIGSFENLLQFGERSRDKVYLDDFAVRDLAAEQRERAAAAERKAERERNSTMAFYIER